MNLLKKDLGKALRAKEVAEYLALDEKTVRCYYQELGGMRLGRSILFFERSVINAIQSRTEVEIPSAEDGGRDGAPKGEELQLEERGVGVGSRDEAETRRRVEREDRHGLLG